MLDGEGRAHVRDLDDALGLPGREDLVALLEEPIAPGILQRIVLGASLLTGLILPGLEPLVLGQGEHLAANHIRMLLDPRPVLHGGEGYHHGPPTLLRGEGVCEILVERRPHVAVPSRALVNGVVPRVGVGHAELLRVAAEADVEHDEAVAVFDARNLLRHALGFSGLPGQQLLHGVVVSRRADDLLGKDLIAVLEPHAHAAAVLHDQRVDGGAHENAASVALDDGDEPLGKHL
mmetsp:Transcript_42540/g.133302  ORF Transcript_42540/g.133302 Transcript_42540/m.133302 type:complete len:234 (+) Transcript_42540:767-1468(+)